MFLLNFPIFSVNDAALFTHGGELALLLGFPRLAYRAVAYPRELGSPLVRGTVRKANGVRVASTLRAFAQELAESIG